jgi:hypothetical protein
MHLNWQAISHFDPSSPDPFATHGIPVPNYGNYGGANYSAGEIGGHITGTSADPPPVDPLDALFYQHDLVYQTSTNPLVRAAADVQLVESMHALTYTDPGDAHYDPEAGLYEGFATLGIVAQLTAGGVLPHLPLADQLLIAEGTREAVVNIEAGLAARPGEAKSVHGAFHLFEHRFLDTLPQNNSQNDTFGGELPGPSSAAIAATSQLTQAMAGFAASGAAATLNAALVGPDTSQQSLLAAPQHA